MSGFDLPILMIIDRSDEYNTFWGGDKCVIRKDATGIQQALAKKDE